MQKNNFLRYEKFESLQIKKSTIISPEISIVIPTYNRDILLKEALDSALFQNKIKMSYEIIVVEDCGDKNTKIEKLFETYNDGKISYYKNQKNLGLFGNWNRTIELARGKWICMLNDDDLLLPNFLEEISVRIKNNKKADLIFYKPIITDNFSEKYNFKENLELQSEKKRKEYFVKTKFFLMGDELAEIVGFVFRKDFAMKLGGFDEDFYPSADYDFFYRYTSLGNIFIYDGKIISVSRQGENESKKESTIKGFVIKDFEIKQKIIREQNYKFKNFLNSYIKVSMIKQINTLNKINKKNILDFEKISQELNLKINLLDKIKYKIIHKILKTKKKLMTREI
ncbi:MAG: glycosyltransferase family 2 protein [Fusobacteriaceae bacterium]